MLVEFIKPRNGIPLGAIRDMSDGAANLLIRRHFCREVEEKQQSTKLKRSPNRKTIKHGSNQGNSE